MRLTSLKHLYCYVAYGETRLTYDQESAIQLLTSLQKLEFTWCKVLQDLPVGLHSLPSLRKLVVTCCRSIKRLPEQGLPPSLEELVISGCSKELTEQCMMLPTSKLKAFKLLYIALDFRKQNGNFCAILSSEIQCDSNARMLYSYSIACSSLQSLI
ncbi:hypothetical protein EJB05_38289, partial [Eragrostis curvula]